MWDQCVFKVFRCTTNPRAGAGSRDGRGVEPIRPYGEIHCASSSLPPWGSQAHQMFLPFKGLVHEPKALLET